MEVVKTDGVETLRERVGEDPVSSRFPDFETNQIRKERTARKFPTLSNCSWDQIIQNTGTIIWQCTGIPDLRTMHRSRIVLRDEINPEITSTEAQWLHIEVRSQQKYITGSFGSYNQQRSRASVRMSLRRT